MIQLNITPERQAALEAGAAAAGVDVATFVWQAVEDRLEEFDNKTVADAPYEVWKREYEALKSTLKARNASLDDSRESIYD